MTTNLYPKVYKPPINRRCRRTITISSSRKTTADGLHGTQPLRWKMPLYVMRVRLHLGKVKREPFTQEEIHEPEEREQERSEPDAEKG